MAAPNSQVMAHLVGSVMTRGALMLQLPIVLLAAPAIRAFSLRLTREEGSA